jgi:hypothetical protein
MIGRGGDCSWWCFGDGSTARLTAVDRIRSFSYNFLFGFANAFLFVLFLFLSFDHLVMSSVCGIDDY